MSGRILVVGFSSIGYRHARNLLTLGVRAYAPPACAPDRQQRTAGRRWLSS